MATAEIVYYSLVRWHAYGTLTAANDKWPVEMPEDFEIIQDSFGGSQGTLGSGAGTHTQIQLRNATKTPDLDYFSTRPTIEVDSNTRRVEGGELISDARGSKGDIVWLDLDAVPGGGSPANLEFWVLCRFTRKVG